MIDLMIKMNPRFSAAVMGAVIGRAGSEDLFLD